MSFLDPKTKEQVNTSIERVKSGYGTTEDYRVTNEAAKQAGSTGNNARKALEESAKKSK